jgi:hypothetical protein
VEIFSSSFSSLLLFLPHLLPPAPRPETLLLVEKEELEHSRE